MKSMSVFSTRIKTLRNNAGLSQQELSKLIGVSKSSINMYERGEREPGLDTVRSFADYFDVQTDYLLGKSDDTRSVSNGKKYNRIIIDYVEKFRASRGYSKEFVEKILDWNGMYNDLENNLILCDESFLSIIQTTLKFFGFPEERKEKPAAISDELWEAMQNNPRAVALLELLLKMSPEQMDALEKVIGREEK